MNRKIIFIVIGLIAFLVILNLIGQIYGAFKSGDKLTEAAEGLYQLEVKNKELKEQLRQIKSPDFIEQQARDKLGLAKEGETVVVIPQEQLEKVLGAAKRMEEEVKLPNWLGWIKVFFK